MSSLVLGIAGGAIGGFFGGAFGARIGFLVGSAAGSYLDQSRNKQKIEGPRLNDRRYQTSAYGQMIPICQGTIGVAGNVIWASDLEEESRTEESGGKGGPSTTTTLYSYFANFAVSLCEGPIVAVPRIWANGRLWYDANASSQGYTDWTLYLGTETQMPDPTIESFRGVGNVPAYRGQAYIVFSHMPVEQFGNRIPQLFFEVCTAGTVGNSIHVVKTASYAISSYANECIFGSDGTLWGCNVSSNNEPIREINASNGNDLSTWTPPTEWSYRLCVPTTGGRFYGVATHPGAGQKFAYFDPHAQTETHIRNLGDTADEYPPRMPAPIGDDCLFVFVPSFPANEAYAARVSGSTLHTAVVSGANIGNANRLWLSMVNPRDYGYGATDGSFYYPVSERDLDTNRYTLFRFNAVTLELVSSHTAPATGSAGNCFYWQGKLYIATTANEIHRWDSASMTHELTLPCIGRWICLTQDSNFIITTSSSAPNATLIDLRTFTVSGTITSAFPQGGIGPYCRDTGSNRMMQVHIAGAVGSAWTLYNLLINQVATETVPLSEVVSAYCSRAGLAGASLDVAQLATVPVRGTLVARQCSARQAIESLSGPYFFDGVESGSTIKFVRRGGSIVATIPDGDLIAAR